MFLCKARETGKDSIRKVVDFRLLNAHSHTWNTQCSDTMSALREIPSAKTVFIVLDIFSGFSIL